MYGSCMDCRGGCQGFGSSVKGGANGQFREDCGHGITWALEGHGDSDSETDVQTSVVASLEEL